MPDISDKMTEGSVLITKTGTVRSLFHDDNYDDDDDD
jgi:hypothetical protein